MLTSGEQVISPVFHASVHSIELSLESVTSLPDLLVQNKELFVLAVLFSFIICDLCYWPLFLYDKGTYNRMVTEKQTKQPKVVTRSCGLFLVIVVKDDMQTSCYTIMCVLYFC
jgi:hypothetical protein